MSDKNLSREALEIREQRADKILDAAITVLQRHGYKKTSMLAIAREASASKETLYSWFGDKHGLFAALIQRNATHVQSELRNSLEHNLALTEALPGFGRELLRLLLGEAAVALNRAAICEATSDPALGEMIVRYGRNAAMPVLVSYLVEQRSRGTLAFADGGEAAGSLLGLLIGDHQVLRLLGVMSCPDTDWIEQRSEQAVRRFLSMVGANQKR